MRPVDYAAVKTGVCALPPCEVFRESSTTTLTIYTLKSNRKIRLRIYLSQSFFLDVVSPFLEYVFAADLCFIKSVINTRTKKEEAFASSFLVSVFVLRDLNRAAARRRALRTAKKRQSLPRAPFLRP